MRLDSHQHFWRYSAAEYPWIPPASALARDWLPADLESLQKPLNFDGSIAVQARQSLTESQWLLALAEADPRIQGVVGWVDLQNDRVEDELVPLARHPKFVGVRHVVQDEPDDEFVLRPAFQRGLQRLRDHGLRYDLLVYPRQLPATIRLVEAFPEQPFVLDHIAKPLIREAKISPWREQIRELARFPHVHCKISGMITEADHVHWQPTDLAPYLEVILEAFGPSRLMFGSDWPVCLLAGSYERVFRVVDEYLTTRATWTEEERARFWGENCARFYGVRMG
ncbi:MAG: amidohydrolase family protein [Verrucomicrobia bacterium]|nr:amidohydrolase family protein [Verrucomicrobiota bacterium]